jgi:hypothetical protein
LRWIHCRLSIYNQKYPAPIFRMIWQASEYYRIKRPLIEGRFLLEKAVGFRKNPTAQDMGLWGPQTKWFDDTICWRGSQGGKLSWEKFFLAKARIMSSLPPEPCVGAWIFKHLFRWIFQCIAYETLQVSGLRLRYEMPPQESFYAYWDRYWDHPDIPCRKERNRPMARKPGARATLV